MSAEHRRPTLAFVVLVVLAIAVIGVHRADAGPGEVVVVQGPEISLTEDTATDGTPFAEPPRYLPRGIDPRFAQPVARDADRPNRVAARPAAPAADRSERSGDAARPRTATAPRHVVAGPSGSTRTSTAAARRMRSTQTTQTTRSTSTGGTRTVSTTSSSTTRPTGSGFTSRPQPATRTRTGLPATAVSRARAHRSHDAGVPAGSRAVLLRRGR